MPGVIYFYWLEDVDIYGVKTRHGPVSATIAAVPDDTLPPLPAGSGQ